MGRVSLPHGSDDWNGSNDREASLGSLGPDPNPSENLRMWDSLPGALLQKIFQLNIESAPGWAGRRVTG